MTSVLMSVLARKIAVLAAVAGLCAALAGCVSDAAAPASQSSGTQLRYYGGPKSPMWPAE
jgi:hypothetical protein